MAESPTCCLYMREEPYYTEQKIYQAFLFSVPIVFVFFVIYLIYLFYSRPASTDWNSLRVRANSLEDNYNHAEMGLKKEVREKLPTVVHKESKFVTDTVCPVCLEEYHPEDRLQQLPVCGHTFHMECLDRWLAKRVTCPICRLSLLPSGKFPWETQYSHRRTAGRGSPPAGDGGQTSAQLESESEPQHTLVPWSRNEGSER